MCQNKKIKKSKKYMDYVKKFNESVYQSFENGEKFSKSVHIKVKNEFTPFLLDEEENKIFFQELTLNKCTDLTKIIDFDEYPSDTNSVEVPFFDFSLDRRDNIPNPNPTHINIDAIPYQSTGYLSNEKFLDVIQNYNMFEFISSYAEQSIYNNFRSLFIQRLNSIPYEKVEKNTNKTRMNLYSCFNVKELLNVLVSYNNHPKVLLSSKSLCFHLISGRKKSVFENLNFITRNKFWISSFQDGFVYLGDFRSIFKAFLSSSYTISIDFGASSSKQYPFTLQYSAGFNHFPNVQNSIAVINFC